MHRIGFLLCDKFAVMALSTQAVFEVANHVTKQPFYQIGTYSIDGGLVRSSLGLQVHVQSARTVESNDTWVVLGATESSDCLSSQRLSAFLRDAHKSGCRIVGMSTGAFALAAAGLLWRKHATTNWAGAPTLQQSFPDVHLDSDRMYVADGTVWTSAGETAGYDLSLALVERDLGHAVATTVARRLLVRRRRAVGQVQYCGGGEPDSSSDRIRSAMNYARGHLHHALSVAELADAAQLGVRQFSRIVKRETGLSPARIVESIRLDAARKLIEQSQYPLDEVAKRTGFRDRRHLREVFVRRLGVTPQAVRREGPCRLK